MSQAQRSIEVLRVDHVRTDENLTYPSMKGLVKEKVHNTSIKMGLLSLDNYITRDGNLTLILGDSKK